MALHRTYCWTRKASEAAGFASWNAAGRALVTVTDRPNDTGAVFGDCDAAEVRIDAGGKLVVAARTVRGAIYFLARRS